MLMSGNNYISSIQLHSNTLYTRGKATRGRSQANGRCKTCKVYESLRHILQACSKTWAKRTERHDALVSKVAKTLEERGYEMRVEPIIQTNAGIWKPDILAIIPGVSATVTDATIITDSSDLRTSHELKRQYAVNSRVCLPTCRSCRLRDGIQFSYLQLAWGTM